MSVRIDLPSCDQLFFQMHLNVEVFFNIRRLKVLLIPSHVLSARYTRVCHIYIFECSKLISLEYNGIIVTIYRRNALHQ